MARLRRFLGLDGPEWSWITRGWDRSVAVILTVAAINLTIFRAYGSNGAFQRFQWGLGNHPRFLLFGDFWWFACSAVLLGVIPWITLRVLTRRDPGLADDRGTGLGDWRYGLRGSALLLAIIMPVIFAVSRSPQFYNYYPLSDWIGSKAVDYATSGQPSDWLAWLIAYELAYAVYFLGWEYFFRGYLAFGLHSRMGVLGLFVGNIPFALLHANKPFPEAMGSVVAGIALGLFALRARSFWYAWAVHVIAACSMDLLSLERRISLGS